MKLILSAKDRTVGVQGYAGTDKTAMLNRARALLEKRGFEVAGLAPSASAARTLAAEAGVESETLQRFLARNAGVAEGRLTARGERAMRAAFGKTVLVVDEGSLASTVHAFQGRTVDTVIAAMEANHPHLTTQKTLYVEISRARDRAELVTDDRNALRERLEAATGERIAALEAVEPERAKLREQEHKAMHGRDREGGVQEKREQAPRPVMEKAKESPGVELEL